MLAVAQSERLRAAWSVLALVPDPEVPVVSVCELGMVRDVLEQDGSLEVVLTPTYSGCPATELICADVKTALEEAKLGPVKVRLQRSPAWTTDWISDATKQKLRDYGIAPPSCLSQEKPIRLVPRRTNPSIECPRCTSTQTERLAQHGSTACKALYRCLSCKEPFEYFKPI